MRAYKTVNDTYIEPISFTVPRKAETFQADIYPPAIGLKPAFSAKEWIQGKSGIPPKIDLESVYEGNAPVEVPADYKPPTATVSAPAPKPAPRKEASPVRAPAPASRGPPPSMADQKGSISAMANKYQDDEEDGNDDDASSFEEIAPVQRYPPKSSAASAAPPPRATQATPKSPVKATPPPAAQPQQQPPKTSVSSPPAAAASGGGGGATLDQIRALLEAQTRIITAQDEKINQLVADMENLKRKVGAIGAGSQDQSERIRQLELELEEARS